MFPQQMLTAVHTVPINDVNKDLLRGGFDEWLPDVRHRQPFVAVVENNRAISICASVRISDAVHCAGVETIINRRSSGNAAKAVEGWAASVQALGAAPFYSTSWENTSSQRVADRLHLDKAGADFHVT